MLRSNFRGRAIESQSMLAATAIPALCVCAPLGPRVSAIRFHICLTARGLLINVRVDPDSELQPVEEPVHLMGSPVIPSHSYTFFGGILDVS